MAYESSNRNFLLKERAPGPKPGNNQPGHEGGRGGSGTRPSGTGNKSGGNSGKSGGNRGKNG